MAAPDEPIRILVVDDTVVYRKIVTDILRSVPGVEVVGVAANGRIALQMIDQHEPDLLTLDLEMPELDGLGVLRALRGRSRPVHAIMLSAFTSDGARTTMAALSEGAFDFVLKPSDSGMKASEARLRATLVGKIEAYRSSMRTRRPRQTRRPAEAAARTAPKVKPSTPQGPRRGVPAGCGDVVAIGISTGGPPALGTVLPQLSGSVSVPILIVQHMPPVFTKSLADDLNRRSTLSVCEAENGQIVQPGHVYIAPGGAQMKVVRQGVDVVVRITDDPPENSCRPSVDYLFRSVVQVYGAGTLGVIMTGMGDDGADGCEVIKRAGGHVIAQDEQSCVVFGMPKRPVESGIADAVVPLGLMAQAMMRGIKTGVAV